ncbi:hypothetical protein [Sphingomonas phyllosphaerae]|uniref:hypothetical protein n=1 Tax=Sphingomonas phyllosphaerae TaxID=257003 RepID=UPI0003F75D4B|nr:hypothetical protein [Sphingomonas phyllosphaerae]
MSIAQIEAEIRRFLSTDAPEVLCIKGRWGVGKTYGWRAFLRAAQADGSLAMQRYSYVSLFGQNSVDGLRYALFETTVTGANIGREPDEATFGELVADRDTARKLGRLVGWAGTIFNRKGVADLLAQSAFLMVRRQLVCLDDLERAGTGIRIRDVLGLSSLLKEERKCKVVLLLNDEEHDERDEFERQLEKVADVTVRFDPTPAEAAAIALDPASDAGHLLTPRVVELGITNIRVIKKIERLAVRLLDLLAGHDEGLVAESVATIALAGWAVQQPGQAPTLGFLRDYNSIAMTMRAGREPLHADAQRFRAMLADYPYRWASDLDRAIIDGAEQGYFADDALRATAAAVAAERRVNSRDNAFTRVWEELYHGSLATEDHEFLDALRDSATAEAAAISPLNINSAVRVLREAGRGDEADRLVTDYVAARDDEAPGFFEIGRHHFTAGDRLDDALRDAFAARLAAHVDPRDPLEVLRSIGERRGWDDEDAALMARQGADDFERMFLALRGPALKPALDMVRAMGRSHLPASDAIEAASAESLRRIAARSELRRQRLQAWGVLPDRDAAADADGEAADAAALG